MKERIAERQKERGIEKMVQYIDNGVVCGWYYKTYEGFIYGDGTLEAAEEIEKEINGD